MLVSMASLGKTFQRIAEQLVFSEAPKLVRQLQKSDSLPRSIQQGIKMGVDAGISVLAANQAARTQPALTTGRPVTKNSIPTAHRARRVAYALSLIHI